MTDDDPTPIQPPASNGSGSAHAGQTAVRSGLAHRRNPLLVRLGEIGTALSRILLRDPVSTFLLIASIALAVAFATLLGSIKPSSSGTQVPISTVETLAKQRDIAAAVLLDHDSRVEVTTTATAPKVLSDGTLAS